MKWGRLFLIIATLAAGSQARADVPAEHGMLLFGDKVAYASHLPMFHAPHGYQVILKLSLERLGKSHALSKYAAAKAAGHTLFTLVPQVLDLTQVIDGTLKAFQAAIYDGHFEQGGKSLGLVDVSVAKLIFAAKLNPHARARPSEQYLVFGENGSYFAAHLIGGKPSFDAIVSVTQPQKLNLPTCRTRACPDPTSTPVADAELPLTLSAVTSGTPAAGDSLHQAATPYVSLNADIASVLYLESDELSK